MKDDYQKLAQELQDLQIKYAELVTKFQKLKQPEQKMDDCECSEMEISKQKELENSLQASEEKYRILFQKSTDPILIINDSAFIDCNEAAWKILKYKSKSNILGKHPWELSPEYQPDGISSKEKAEKLVQQAIEEGYCRFEWIHLNKNGEEIWFDIALTHVPEKGKSYIHTVWRNITKNKEIEKAHLNSEYRYKTLTEITIEGIFVHDNNAIVDVNPAAAIMLRSNAEALIGRSIFAIIDSKYHEVVKKRVSQNIEGAYELEMLRDDGTTFFAEVEAKYALIDENKFRVVAVRDISDRKKTEAALKESEEKFRNLAETTPSAIMIYQNDFWVYSNRAGCEMSGYSEDELRKMKFWDFIHPDHKEIVKNHGSNRQSGKETEMRYEFKIVTKNGHTKWVDLTGGVTSFKGKPAAIISVNDITKRKIIENNLKESEERFKFLSKATFEGIVIHKLGKVIDANDSFIRLTGYDKDEIIGKNMLDYVPKAIDRAKILSNIVKKSVKPYIVEARVKDGSIRMVELEAKNVKHNNRNVRIAAVRDVTEKKEAEAALKDSERKYKDIVTLAPIGFYQSLQNGKIITANDSLAVMLGYKNSEDLKQNVNMRDLYYENNREELIKKFDINGDGKIKNVEIMFRKKDGTPIWVLLTSQSIKNELGETKYYDGFVADINDFKKSEEALRESEDNFRQLTENIDQVFWLTDWKSKKLLYVSPAFEKIYGMSVQSAYDNMMNWKNVIHPEDKQMVDKIFWESAKEEKYVEATYRIITGDGSIKWLYDRSYPIFDEAGEIHRFVSIAEDITVRKLAEEKIENLLKEKEIILREVHHRIKNNMASLESLIRLQTRMIKDPEAISALQDTMSRLKSMRILYDKLYRSENFGEVPMKSYLTNLVNEIMGIFPNQDSVKLEMNIQDFMVNTKITFPLGIIINELITNIMKYAFQNSENNKITILASEKKGKVMIVVQDNGVGISDSIDLKTTTGFGLQIVEMLVEQIHGSVQFIKENGTKFVLEIDL